MIRAIKLGIPAIIEVYDTKEVRIVLESPEQEALNPLFAPVCERELERFVSRDYYPDPTEPLVEYMRRNHWQIVSYDKPGPLTEYPEDTVF